MPETLPNLSQPSTPLKKAEAGRQTDSHSTQLWFQNMNWDSKSNIKLDQIDSLMTCRESNFSESSKKAPYTPHQGIAGVNITPSKTHSTMDSPMAGRSSPPNLTRLSILTPPTTPTSPALKHLPNKAHTQQRPLLTHRRRSSSDFCFDIKNIEFDTTDAQLLGTGAWSKVYKLSTAFPLSIHSSSSSSTLMSPPLSPLYAKGEDDNGKCSDSSSASPLTPPSTPLKPTPSFSLPRALAIKVATRNDALPVFEAEARILSHLHSSPQSSPPSSSSSSGIRDDTADEPSEKYVIPFYGLSTRSRALIFQCANAGTLEDLISRSSSRSAAETLDLFATLAPQLISGLAFLHRKGVVHADIKPANILLDYQDVSSSSSGDSKRLRARFADFSASFICPSYSDSSSHNGTLPTPSSSSAAKTTGIGGGGTWSFMAPELLHPSTPTPTFSSDVYSLATVLLSLLAGTTNPFSAVSSNVFLLREAVKMGDVMQFLLREDVCEKRLLDCEEEWKKRGGEGKVVGGVLRGTLRKKGEERVSAEEWRIRVCEMLK